MTPALTIGQLAKATGVASKTIRYYEQIGVLPMPRRSAARYRQYDQAGVQRLRFIRRARSLTMPLREIRHWSRPSRRDVRACGLDSWYWSDSSSWLCSTGPVSSSCCSCSWNEYCAGC
jgi:hypothetical protein